jgi:hypothetical protein
MPDSERGVVNARLDAILGVTPLVRLLGVDLGLRLAALGLRTALDLDRLVRDYREGELTGPGRLTIRERAAVLGALLRFCRREWLRLLAEVRQSTAAAPEGPSGAAASA